MATLEKNYEEEIINSITHGFGAFISVIATIFLVISSLPFQDKGIHLISALIYGTSMILLYSASSVYHAVQDPISKSKLKIVDHACIYLLIAGTYTPFFLIAIKGNYGLILMSIIWGLAFSGVIFKLFFYTHKLNFLSTILYLMMGWISVFIVPTLLKTIPFYGLVWLIIGGILYTLGTIFYIKDNNKYFHAIWHLFVLGGSVSHYIAVLFYVMPIK
ncbi:MAG: hemolysin III family protein [Candidatus Sericytochromatia bacterium]|nr:hemolysin III family protein [Candidatus Sericytochromatia bacterium]